MGEDELNWIDLSWCKKTKKSAGVSEDSLKRAWVDEAQESTCTYWIDCKQLNHQSSKWVGTWRQIERRLKTYVEAVGQNRQEWWWWWVSIDDWVWRWSTVHLPFHTCHPSLSPFTSPFSTLLLSLSSSTRHLIPQHRRTSVSTLGNSERLCLPSLLYHITKS